MGVICVVLVWPLPSSLSLRESGANFLQLLRDRGLTAAWSCVQLYTRLVVYNKTIQVVGILRRLLVTSARVALP